MCVVIAVDAFSDCAATPWTTRAVSSLRMPAAPTRNWRASRALNRALFAAHYLTVNRLYDTRMTAKGLKKIKGDIEALRRCFVEIKNPQQSHA